MSEMQARIAETSEKLGQRELAILQLIDSGMKNPRPELARQAGLESRFDYSNRATPDYKGVGDRIGTGTLSFGAKTCSVGGTQGCGLPGRRRFGFFYLRIVITDINGDFAHKFQTRTEMQEGRERVLEKTFLSIHHAIRESNIPKDGNQGDWHRSFRGDR